MNSIHKNDHQRFYHVLLISPLPKKKKSRADHVLSFQKNSFQKHQRVDHVSLTPPKKETHQHVDHILLAEQGTSTQEQKEATKHRGLRGSTKKKRTSKQQSIKGLPNKRRHQSNNTSPRHPFPFTSSTTHPSTKRRSKQSNRASTRQRIKKCDCLHTCLNSHQHVQFCLFVFRSFSMKPQQFRKVCYNSDEHERHHTHIRGVQLCV